MTRRATLSVRPLPLLFSLLQQGHAAAPGSAPGDCPGAAPAPGRPNARARANGQAASLRAGNPSNAWNVNFNNGNDNNNDISNTNEVRCVRGS